MIKELMHDPIFLAGKSEVATKEDLRVAQDLLDSLMAHRESCVGMAANMIGVRKRIIAFLDESGRAPTYTVMLNPQIVAKSGIYETEEDAEFIEFIKNYNEQQKPKVLELLEKYGDKNIVIFKSREEADAFLIGENL